MTGERREVQFGRRQVQIDIGAVCGTDCARHGIEVQRLLPLRAECDLRPPLIGCEHRIARQTHLEADDILAESQPGDHGVGIEALARHRNLHAIIDIDARAAGAQREILGRHMGHERGRADLLIGAEAAHQGPGHEAASRRALDLGHGAGPLQSIIGVHRRCGGRGASPSRGEYQSNRSAHKKPRRHAPRSKRPQSCRANLGGSPEEYCVQTHSQRGFRRLT